MSQKQQICMYAYPIRMAIMKVIAGVRLAMAETNVTDVKAMLSIYKF